MPEDISPDMLAELLSPKKEKKPTGGGGLSPRAKMMIRHRTQYPSRNGKYLKFWDTPKSCASRRCGIETYATYEGIPYCTVHGEYKLLEIIERLETQLDALKRANTTNMT